MTPTNFVYKKLFIALFTLTICYFTQNAFGQSEVLASVNNEAITFVDLLKRTAAFEEKIKSKLNGEKLTKALQDVRLKALNDMINERLLAIEYKSLDFSIPDSLKKTVMDKLAVRKGFKSLIEYEEKGNSIFTLEDEAKEQIGIQTLLHQYTGHGSTVTPKQAHEYYENNKDKFLVPKLYSVRLLYVASKDVEPEKYGQIVAECYDGVKQNNSEKIDALVKKYSNGPNPDKGGALGYLPLNKMGKEFSSIIGSKGVSEITGPIIYSHGTYFLFLDGVKESFLKPFKEVSKAVQTYLKNEERAKKKSEYIKKLKEKHTVVISSK